MFNFPTWTRDLLKNLLRGMRCAIGTYQKYWKAPEAIDPDYEIPVALFFWHELRDCCGLYGYQSDPGLLIALKQLWCTINDKHIKHTLQINQPTALSLQHSILSDLSWMFFRTSCSCLLWKIKEWASAGEVSGNLVICCFGPCMWFHSERADTQSGGWTGALAESEKSAPHWMLLS